ncbi:MAG: hypothetical protein ACKVOM_08435 [Ferruginibacter sp.]
MTSKELIRVLLKRINKVKILIFVGGVAVAILMYMFAKNKPVVYSVKSSLYPLSAPADASSATSKISELLGGSGGSKTLSDEANVNIEEVARSRKTREAVVSQRLSIFGNKTIAEILIDDHNKNKSFFASTIKKPSVVSELYSSGASLLADYYTVKFNKNNLLEIYFSHTNKKLIAPTSLILVDKVSQFYKELKIKKAQLDFDFTQKKVDSLEVVLRKFDNQRIALNNTTLFVPQGKLQYSVPKENLERDKLLVLSQRNGAASNREEALWRLQKVTPTIEILDAPLPPFLETKTSKIIYSILGFAVGCILLTCLSIADILYKYLNLELKKKLADTVETTTVTTTA